MVTRASVPPSLQPPSTSTCVGRAAGTVTNQSAASSDVELEEPDAEGVFPRRLGAPWEDTASAPNAETAEGPTTLARFASRRVV